MPEKYRQELDAGLRAVWTAAQVCRSIQATITPEVLSKKDRSPVTIADFASQAVICRALAEAFPGDPIVAEEESAALGEPQNATFAAHIVDHLKGVGVEATEDQVRGWIDRGSASGAVPRFWTLDPIDGTKGFLRKEQYAVSLALIVDGRIEVGLLCCPNLPLGAGDDRCGAAFYAVRGNGSWMVPLDGAPSESPIQMSTIDDPAGARFCESVESGHSAQDVAAEVARRAGIAREPLRLDSQAKYAVVARGEAEIYLRLPTRADYREKIWDHAGGVLVVEEAGGVVTDVDGRPLEFHHGSELVANRGIVAASASLHPRVLEAVRQVLSGTA